jgi:sugar lactone lactonase YvrE
MMDSKQWRASTLVLACCVTSSLGLAHAATPVAASGYVLESLVPRSSIHGTQGIAIGPDGALYVASLTGATIHRVDPRSGATGTAVAAPTGAADDLAFAASGEMVWTGGPDGGSLMSRSTSGHVGAMLTGAPGLNAVRFSPEGRLYVTRIFGGDGLYEVERSGEPRLRPVVEKIGGLNAFDFDASGRIVGPLFFKGQVVAIDPQSGRIETLAEGFQLPSSVRMTTSGAMLVLEYWTGKLWQVGENGSPRRLLAQLEPPTDNFVISADGRKAFVTTTGKGGITEIDLANGAHREVVAGGFSSPGMIDVVELDGRETLLIGDRWAPRAYDVASRSSSPLPLGPNGMGVVGLSVAGGRWVLAKAPLFSDVHFVDRKTGQPTGQSRGIALPTGMIVEAGAVLVADHAEDVIWRIDPAAPEAPTRMAAGLDGPVGIAGDRAGGYYVTEHRGGNLVRLRHDGGGEAPLHRQVVARGLDRPEGIAVDAAGRVLVAESGKGRLLAVDPGSGRIETIATGLRIGASAGGPPDDPFLTTGVAVTRDGSIFVSGDVENELYRIRRK